MGTPKDLNNPGVYAEALYQAAKMGEATALARWLADDPEADHGPFWKWYLHFAERLIDMVPEPERGFVVRDRRTSQPPRIGRNDACPCGSGKKFKQCHLGQENTVAWKLGSPTPVIRAMATARLIHECPPETLDQVPRDKASAMVLTEMAATYHGHGFLNDALELLSSVLAGDRDDPYLLWDYWIARNAEWLVEAGREKEGEQFLLDEYDHPRRVEQWQVAQKLAAFYIDLGDTENADTWVNTAMEGNAENPFNHYLKGMLLHHIESWDEAIAAYHRAEELMAGFRDDEKMYMNQLVTESLTRAENRQPLEDEDEESVDGTPARDSTP
ncbi:MAG: SEC-C domain-containing protein [Magnetococcales bacterium]|nr:SEC-C domain-containing protein [Magnetococcales bacterium]MBF0151499.1 SEC-C domain-containing protein [Magnetococcales bacterium]